MAVSIVLTSGILSGRAIVVVSEESEFAGDSFAALSAEEKGLLREFEGNIALVRQGYRHSTVHVRRERFEAPYPPGNDQVEPGHEELAVRSRIEILQSGDARFRMLSNATLPDGTEHIEMLLVNEGDGWSLKKESAATEWFLRKHGPKLAEKSYRWDFWWADAAFSFAFHDLGDELLRDQQRSRLQSVTESLDEHGNRIVEIRRLKEPLPQYADELHGDSITEVFRFYRDHFWVVRSVESRGHVHGTSHQALTTQECEYHPFTSELPLLRRVRYVTQFRDLSERSDELAWKPVGRQELMYDSVDFRLSDASAFSIETFIDTARRLKFPGIDRLKWFFGANGLGLLALWYLLSRRQETRRPE